MNPQRPFSPTQPPDDDTLLAYAEGRLSPDEVHAVESWLATETPEADAIEGLQMLPAGTADALRQRIQNRLPRTARKSRRERRKQPISQRWVLAAIVTVLVLVALAALYFFLFRKTP